MDDLIQNLRDAGCDPQTLETVCRLYENHQTADAVKALRRYRCHLMDALHESQERVDCLDFLIRRMGKELA